METIREIERSKEVGKKHPTHATRMEIIQAVNDSLNRLYSTGRIQVGETGNDKWIKAKD